jgi:hypothetical protein
MATMWRATGIYDATIAIAAPSQEAAQSTSNALI